MRTSFHAASQATCQTHSDHLALEVILQPPNGPTFPLWTANLGSPRTKDREVGQDLRVLTSNPEAVVVMQETHKRPVEELIPAPWLVHRAHRNAVAWNPEVYPHAVAGEFLLSPRFYVGLRGKGFKGWVPPQYAATLTIRRPGSGRVAIAGVHLCASQRFKLRRRLAIIQAGNVATWARETAQHADVAVGGDWNNVPDSLPLTSIRRSGLTTLQQTEPLDTMHHAPIDAVWTLGRRIHDHTHPAICPTCGQPWPA